jgi:phage replication-related protein YjqB (UPF0714/DUF867 family)
MPDHYSSFVELARSEMEGRDFRVFTRAAASRYAIVAPHGGRIERGTSRIASEIAGAEHGYYAFEGLKNRANARLHITSDRFDEPRALALVARAQTVISIHGARGAEVRVYFGGLDLGLRERLAAALIRCGFDAGDDPSPTRQGRGATNLCNRGTSGRGVQIELPVGMRQVLFSRVDAAGGWAPNAIFGLFVAAVRAELAR